MSKARPGGITAKARGSARRPPTEPASLDEELQSTKEELETAKEELQATNVELDRRNHELQLLDADLVGLLETVEVPLVLLDAKRRIRRFTAQAGASLNLTPATVGKPIGDVALDLHAPDLDLWVAQAMQTGAIVEAEVQDRTERWHRMRVRPQRGLDGRAAGAIVSLVDIPANVSGVSSKASRTRPAPGGPLPDPPSRT